MAALVQALARGIDTDRTKVVFDPHLQHNRRIFGNRRPEVFLQRGFDPLARGLIVVNLRFAAGHIDLQRHVTPQNIAPRELPRPLVELRKMHDSELSDPRQNPRRAP